MSPASVDTAAGLLSAMMRIPELQADIELAYLAEGGANIVYRMVMPESCRAKKEAETEWQHTYGGRLLRLRKKIGSGTPYIETAINFDSQIKALFHDSELVEQTLVALPKDIVSVCNAQLESDEASGRRPKGRRGGYLSLKEPFGLLITDMSPSPNSGASLWEFKPKWLLQSPSAPPNAKRCRTCALREMKNFYACQRGEKTSRAFCPLDLVSSDFDDVLRAVRLMKGPQHERSRLAKFLHQHPTLLKLRDCQILKNAVGLPGLCADSRERAVSMTIRDCTMFVRVPRDERETPEVRLGDLDFKSGTGGKLEYWRDLETRLIEEGWYHGREAVAEMPDCSLQYRRQRTPA
ncbi:Inositol-pentakisphosphate 2-kinase [Ophidiomyces ophidiicola]|nr:Inositol-pentakisphosphate 2-kinase [Ophidiomyces ophidiicola]KAI2398309.1 Inositol-pentakisphosphate 2-kinase [Ophidiomyces ophidiicola]KAI2410056.1 Inositol-pentakisphosphate 2-kinase [Ophidiomyces ophidiicola]